MDDARTLDGAKLRAVTPDEIEAYRRDGAAVARAIIPPAWIERMRAATDHVLGHPGPFALEYTRPGRGGRFFGDLFLWRFNPDFRAFAFDSPLPAIAAQVLGTHKVNLFFDQLLVKEPGTAEVTPWHQDYPYWPLAGEQTMSIWVPFDPVDADSSAVRYIKGSHRWSKWYRPQVFSERSTLAGVYETLEFETAPDFDAEADRFEFLAWALEPGDCILHHPLTVHGAKGNASSARRRRALSVRYCGDDVTYRPRAATMFDNPALAGKLEGFPAPGGALDSALFPQVWPRTAAAP